MLWEELDEFTNLYGTDYGVYNVRTHIQLSKDKDVVLVWHNNSTLYPEWLPRETGNMIIKKDGTKEKEIVFDIFNGRCGWYMFDRKRGDYELS